MITWLKGKIIRATLRANPDKIFLFGDNLAGEGRGGQAREMRGEPNAVGIPTKKRPKMFVGSFFNDAEYEANCAAMDAAFAKIPAGAHVIVPAAGLGTGLAQLPERAPRTFEYLKKRLEEIADGDNGFRRI
jgi:hypothetical protein